MKYSLGIESNSHSLPGTSGRYWRSAAPDELDGAAWASLVEARITTVIDLRNDSEVPLDRVVPLGVTIVRSPLEDLDDPDYTGLWDGNWAHPEFYLWGIRHWPSLWRVAFTAVADAPGGVLVHCAGGRDRTGLLVAILLEMAGIDREIVLDDYEAGIRGTNAMLLSRGTPDHPAGIPADRLEEVVSTYRAALDAVLDRIPEALEGAGLSRVAARAAAALRAEAT